jgi:hypothetical protein
MRRSSWVDAHHPYLYRCLERISCDSSQEACWRTGGTATDPCPVSLSGLREIQALRDTAMAERSMNLHLGKALRVVLRMFFGHLRTAFSCKSQESSPEATSASSERPKGYLGGKSAEPVGVKIYRRFQAARTSLSSDDHPPSQAMA